MHRCMHTHIHTHIHMRVISRIEDHVIKPEEKKRRQIPEPNRRQGASFMTEVHEEQVCKGVCTFVCVCMKRG